MIDVKEVRKKTAKALSKKKQKDKIEKEEKKKQQKQLNSTYRKLGKKMADELLPSLEAKIIEEAENGYSNTDLEVLSCEGAHEYLSKNSEKYRVAKFAAEILVKYEKSKGMSSNVNFYNYPNKEFDGWSMVKYTSGYVTKIEVSVSW